MTVKRRMLPPVYLLLAFGAMWLLEKYAPLASVLSPPFSYAGVLPIMLGMALAGWGAGLFRKLGTPVIPFDKSTVLVTQGPYRFTRNPMYLGMVVVLVGVWLLLGSASPALVVPLFWLVIEFRFVRAEEAFMEALFGSEYLDYKRRVRRWL